MSEVREEVLAIRERIAEVRQARSSAEARRADSLTRARAAEGALRAAHEARVLERQQLLAKSAMKVRGLGRAQYMC